MRAANKGAHTKRRSPSPVSVAENLEQHPASNNKDEDGTYNYVSDDKENNEPRHVVRRSKRVLQQL